MTQYECLEVIQKAKGWITVQDIAVKLNKTKDQISPPLNKAKTIKGLIFRKRRVGGYLQTEYNFINS
jgi:predicted transcriptional regulator